MEDNSLLPPNFTIEEEQKTERRNLKIINVRFSVNTKRKYILVKPNQSPSFVAKDGDFIYCIKANIGGVYVSIDEINQSDVSNIQTSKEINGKIVVKWKHSAKMISKEVIAQIREFPVPNKMGAIIEALSFGLSKDTINRTALDNLDYLFIVKSCISNTSQIMDVSDLCLEMLSEDQLFGLGITTISNNQETLLISSGNRRANPKEDKSVKPKEMNIEGQGHDIEEEEDDDRCTIGECLCFCFASKSQKRKIIGVDEGYEKDSIRNYAANNCPCCVPCHDCISAVFGYIRGSFMAVKYGCERTCGACCWWCALQMCCCCSK